MKAVLDATPETPSPVICIVENKIVRRPLLEAVAQTKEVAVAIENKVSFQGTEILAEAFANCYP